MHPWCRGGSAHPVWLPSTVGKLREPGWARLAPPSFRRDDCRRDTAGGMTWLFGHGNAPRSGAEVALLVLLNALLRRVDRTRWYVCATAFDSYQRIKPRMPAVTPAVLNRHREGPWRSRPVAVAAHRGSRMVDCARELRRPHLFDDHWRYAHRSCSAWSPKPAGIGPQQRFAPRTWRHCPTTRVLPRRSRSQCGDGFRLRANGRVRRGVWGIASNLGRRMPSWSRTDPPIQCNQRRHAPITDRRPGQRQYAVEGAIVRRVPMLTVTGQRDEDLFPALSAGLRVAGLRDLSGARSGAGAGIVRRARTGIGSIRSASSRGHRCAGAYGAVRQRLQKPFVSARTS
jgi:hypothetical protein